MPSCSFRLSHVMYMLKESRRNTKTYEYNRGATRRIAKNRCHRNNTTPLLQMKLSMPPTQVEGTQVGKQSLDTLAVYAPNTEGLTISVPTLSFQTSFMISDITHFSAKTGCSRAIYSCSAAFAASITPLLVKYPTGWSERRGNTGAQQKHSTKSV